MPDADVARADAHTESTRAIACYVARWVLATLVCGAVVGSVWRIADLPQAVIAGCLGVTLASTVGAAICAEPKTRREPLARLRAPEHYGIGPLHRAPARPEPLDDKVQRLEDRLKELEQATAQTRERLGETQQTLDETRRDLAKAHGELRRMRVQANRKWATRVLLTKGAVFGFVAGLLALLPT